MKKINLLFLVTLFCGFALNSNAQSSSYAFTNTWEFSINCDGVPELIMGDVHGHIVAHFNPETGVREWFKFNFIGDNFVRQSTGEVFSVSYRRKDMDFSLDGLSYYATVQFNLRGNQGSHILVKAYFFHDASTDPPKVTYIDFTTKCL